MLGSRKRFVRKFTEEPQFRSVVADIDSVEREVEKASQSRREVEDLVGRMFSGNKAINFTDTEIRVMTNDNQNIGLVSLSSGEKQVLRIFIEALRADISSLLIDEPEMSLHIDWQRELIRDMQQLNPNTQLILASHSPEIMAEIPDNKIFRL